MFIAVYKRKNDRLFKIEDQVKNINSIDNIDPGAAKFIFNRLILSKRNHVKISFRYLHNDSSIATDLFYSIRI